MQFRLVDLYHVGFVILIVAPVPVANLHCFLLIRKKQATQGLQDVFNCDLILDDLNGNAITTLILGYKRFSVIWTM